MPALMALETSRPHIVERNQHETHCALVETDVPHHWSSSSQMNRRQPWAVVKPVVRCVSVGALSPEVRAEQKLALLDVGSKVFLQKCGHVGLKACERRLNGQKDQTAQRFAECLVQDVDIDNPVLEVGVVVPLVVAQGCSGCVSKDENMMQTDILQGANEAVTNKGVLCS